MATGGGRRLFEAARISFSILSKLSSLELALAAEETTLGVGAPAELSLVY